MSMSLVGVNRDQYQAESDESNSGLRASASQAATTSSAKDLAGDVLIDGLTEQGYGSNGHEAM
jgi:hypothetical protein